MSSVEKTINKTLQQVRGYACELIEQNKKRLSRKQKELAGFFCIPTESLSDLRSSRAKLAMISLWNAMYCFDRFIQESGTIIEEANYDFYNGERVPPARTSLEIAQGVRVRILEDAAVFFEWGGEKYCMEISPNRYSSEGDHDFSLIAKDQNALDLLLETFKAFQKTHHYLKGKKFNGISGAILPISGYDWSDLVWPDGMKERLQSEIEGVFKHAALFNSYALNNKKGFILSGEPGNGKTLLLKILAKETDATCILIPFDEFKFTPYLFSIARDLAPAVLILEDIDLFGTDRDNSSQNVELGKLMNQLDGMVENHEIVVIATTNQLDKVEKALQNRPGRFDRVYVIPNPDFQLRIKLISHFIAKIPNDIKKEQIEMLAEEFAGYSAAYLKELVNSGFAQAILRDGESPVLRFCDLQSMVDILKWKKDKVAVGFRVSEPAMEKSAIQNKAEGKL
ncbi:MAG: ATP-binding protein [Candidatus Omnitrophota bacterium]